MSTKIEQHGVCLQCISITDHAMKFCGECGHEQPEQGWPSLHDERDPWLGETLEEDLMVRQRLGIGGSARVYRVERRVAPTRLALKLVDLEAEALGTADVTEERVRREFMMISGLTSPHIVRIMKFVRPGRTVCGFVMEYADGITLRQWLDTRGPVPVNLALDIVLQVARGLDEAHAAGIVHRDIKPENLMLEELPDGDVHVRIMDFGIAQWGEHGALTQGFLGTPHYASPEQIMGDAVTPASDVYSLGATLYAALTGKPPYSGPSVMDIMRAHVLERTPRLSDATGDMFAPALEQLVATMMQKRAEERPSSTDALTTCVADLRATPGHDEVIPSTLSEVSELMETSETISGESVDVHNTPHRRIVVASTNRVVSVDGQSVVAVVPGTNECKRVPLVFADIVTVAAASSSRFFVGTSDGRVFAEQDGTWFQLLQTPDDAAVTALKASSYSHAVVVGTASGDVLIKRGRAPWQRVHVDDRVSALAIAEHSDAVAVATSTGIRIYQEGEEDVAIEDTDVTDMCFSDDEYLLAILHAEGHVCVRSLRSESAPVLHAPATPASPICALHFTPKSLRAVTAGEGGHVFVEL